jgi:hypothetical protein
LREGDVPHLVISCFRGKVDKNYIVTSAVLDTDSRSLFPLNAEGRLDGKKTSILADAMSTDGTSFFFGIVDLENILKARQAIVGVQEYLGPEIVMQFDVPDISTVVAACGKNLFAGAGRKPLTEASRNKK